jgi:hypothetical protein
MNKIYCWACDYSQSSGEGKLAILFTDKNLKNNYIIYSPKKLFKNNFLFHIANYKYTSPFIGIFFCWFFFLKGKSVCYLNYLPLWNSLLFIFLPPKTILGPITGGAVYYRDSQFLIRNFIFPIFYKISELMLFLRFKNIYFSTELLKKYLAKKNILKSKFNYIFNYFSKNIKKKKDIDFLIYYRKHTNKISAFPYEFIKKLISYKFKIYVIGDKLKSPFVKNFGYVNNFKVNSLLSRTHFSISSNENPYTLFAIECLNNNVRILADNSQKNKINHFKKDFIFIDFQKKNFSKNYLIFKKF